MYQLMLYCSWLINIFLETTIHESGGTTKGQYFFSQKRLRYEEFEIEDGDV